jgi:Putative peptidoglycan binding domain
MVPSNRREERPTQGDPDDWFEEPVPAPPRRPGARRAVQIDPDAPTHEQTALPPDDWLASEPPSRRRRSRTGRQIANRRILATAAIALALLLIGLAVGGVFSGGGKSPSTRPTTTRTAPTTTTTHAPTSLVVPRASLKLGDTGPAVTELQRALESLGYALGKADGDFGSSTQGALMTFQTAHQLTPDGVLGPATRAALVKALSLRG